MAKTLKENGISDSGDADSRQVKLNFGTLQSEICFTKSESTMELGGWVWVSPRKKMI